MARERENISRRVPVGAEVQADGRVHFRVWAPESPRAEIEFVESGREPLWLEREEGGYFSGTAPVAEGALYKIRLESGSYPDPASRFQPEGPHGPSQVVNPDRFAWTDQHWRGVAARDAVLYEMHIGTFTPEGTWAAAAEQLGELKRLGVTLLEVMPIAEFPGSFGWGYDGVDLFAPTRLYGSPEDVRRFVNQAHAIGLGVILDVVYNHLGPDGNYLPKFSKDYFSSKYSCEWGEALNFDGENSRPVREFFIANAAYWIREFHFDGLRLDATQQIFDASPAHVVAEIAEAAKRAGGEREIYLVGENEPQHSRLVRERDAGGCGLTALWNDDYHHSAMVAATGKAEAYYSDYRGAPQEFVSAAKYGFLFQGQRYKWQKKRRGMPALDLAPKNFVVFLQNHDQVANSLRGWRIHQLACPALHRALTGLTLLGPSTPMLFQGEEFAASSPFLYFADHHPELNRLVREGRGKFLRQFRSIECGECRDLLADPGAAETFRRCKLNFEERRLHAPIYRMFQDLLRLRRSDETLRNAEFVDGAVLSRSAFLLRFFSVVGDDRLLIVNLGRDVHLDPAPEPLLAPMEGKGWTILWSSEAPEYGGFGTPPLETDAGWMLPGHAAVLLRPIDTDELPKARLSQED